MTNNTGREIDIEFDDEDEEDTLKDRFLTFKVKNEDYGIEIVKVKEIVGIQDITPVPEMPKYIKGVINLPVQVLEARINELDEYKDKNIAVICRSGNRSVHATKLLLQNGFKAKNVIGGMKAYNKLK